MLGWDGSASHGLSSTRVGVRAFGAAKTARWGTAAVAVSDTWAGSVVVVAAGVVRVEAVARVVGDGCVSPPAARPPPPPHAASMTAATSNTTAPRCMDTVRVRDWRRPGADYPVNVGVAVIGVAAPA